MKLQGRNLSLQMEGADVKLLQTELSQRGYAISSKETDKSVFGEETRLVVFMFQQARGLPTTGIVDDVTAQAINDAFLVQGTVRRENQRPLPQATVRAFDKDLRQEQLIGETTTDQQGFYKILYCRDQFRRAEKRAADLVVRVFHPNNTDSCLGESELIFNAQTMQTVDLTVDMTALSEYEQYVIALTPVREKIPMAQFTKKDIVFLSGETSIPTQRIEWLATAERLARRTNLPSTVFYGLARMELPPDLSNLLGRDPKVIRQALETAVDRNIIPSALRKDLDQVLERLSNLAKVDPGVQLKKQKNKLRNLGKIIDLEDQKIDAVLKKVSYSTALNDKIFETLVKENDLVENEAKELGLTVSLYGLLDDNLELAAAVKKGEFSQLPEGKVSHIQDLTAFDRADWLAVLTQANAKPPSNISREAYATLLAKKIEYLYPSKTLWARMKIKTTEKFTEGLEELQPLFDKNDSVFRSSSFDRLKVEGIAPEKIKTLRETHTRIKKTANTYAGLQITEILDNRQLSAANKEKQINARIELLTRFHAQNPGKEFLFLDYSPDSADLQALNFNGYSANEKRMVLKTVKADQRMYSVTRDVTHTKLLLEAGYHSPLSIANMSCTMFIQDTGLAENVATDYYNQCRSTATSTMMGLGAIHDAVFGGFSQMEVGNIESSIGEYLKKIDGWETLFGNLDYCNCQHCRSIFSPSAYFVDLMHFLTKNVTFEEHGEGDNVAWEGISSFRAREDHPLHLRSRRPDLWQLPLTCENTNTLVPYLDLINEILENYIAVYLKFVAQKDLPKAGEDRSGVDKAVYLALLHSIYSFQQPFSLPLERLNTYLVHFDVTRGVVATLLEEPVDVTAAAVLKLSKYGNESEESGESEDRDPKRREYELISQSRTDIEFLRDIYGLEFTEEADAEVSFVVAGDEAAKNDVQILLKSMNLTRGELGQLIATTFVLTGNQEHGGRIRPVRIQGEKKVPDGADASVQNDIERIHHLSKVALDRMHRFTRLWRHLPWTIRELDLVLDHMAQAGLVHGIEEVTLQHLADILSIQQRLNLTVEEGCSLWSHLPDDSVSEGKESLLDRLFNLPDFVRLNGTFPKDSFRFLHPAFRDTIPPDVDYPLHRLLAGLQVDDQALYQLVTHLSGPLGLDLLSSDVYRKEFTLSLRHLSLLYRHTRLAKKLGLPIPQLFQLICVADVGGIHGVPSNHIADLNDLTALLKFHDWWKSTDYSPDDLAYIRSQSVGNPKAYPDAMAIAEQVLKKVDTNQALAFNHSVFAFLEGVTEEQSREIVAENLGFIDKARGLRYRVAESFNPAADPTTTIQLPETFSGTPEEMTEVRRKIMDLLKTYCAPGAVFDDDLFVTIQGITLEQSQAIVSANATWITSVPLENAYWLHSTFTDAASLTIPAGIPVTQALARDVLLTYHATKVIPNVLAAELGMPAEKIASLIELAGINLSGAEFTCALQENDAEGVLLGLVQTVLPLTVLFKDVVFDSSALHFIREHKELFDGFDAKAIGISNIRLLWIYRGFIKKIEEGGKERQTLQDILFAFKTEDNTFKFYTGETPGATRREIQEKLAQILDAEIGLVITTHDEISLAATALDSLAKLERCLELATRLGVGGDVLKLVVSNHYDKLSKAANAILSAFRAKYNNEEEWRTKIEPFEDKIRSRKRDALTDYLIHSIDLAVFSNLNDLYHYFLIDVELEGCARTSRVVAANSSVQLYVHRILMNLEQDRAGETRLSLSEDAIQEWEWRKNYRVWEANRKVFLYPENYLEPDLRDNKTPLFEELESTLLQQEINEDTVLDAYAKYMSGFQEVANLKIAGSYHDTSAESDILHLFGVTVSDPPVYYYRTIENICRGVNRDPKNIVWNPWRKIDVQIPVWKVSPIVFNKRLYVFWIEMTTTPQNSSLNGGTSHFIGYKHVMALKFTTLRLDGTWTPPQTISLNGSSLNEVDNTIYDPLFSEGKYELATNTEGQTVLTVTPKYGSALDKHFSSVTAGQTYERQPYSGLISYNIGLSSEDQSVLYNGTLGQSILDILHDNAAQITSLFQDEFKPQDYTLKGYKWGQVYPMICAGSDSSTLVIGGRNFEMYSAIDFYRKKLGGLNSDDVKSFFAFSVFQVRDQGLFYKDIFTSIDYQEATRVLSADPGAAFADVVPIPIAILSVDAEVAVINGMLPDCIIDCTGDLLLLQASQFGSRPYFLMRLGTTLDETIAQLLWTEGLDRLFDTDTQMGLKEGSLPLINVYLDLSAFNGGKRDFDGSYGVYYWEIFFHIPSLIANHLNSQGKFAEAQKWYHYIFNPTAKATGTETCPEDRNWRYIEFRERGGIESLRKILKDEQARAAYRKDPFSPHTIARLRPSAYQKAIVMKYIDNLLDWGDSLFAQDTMESINEATLLYVLASDILGERPAELGECGEVSAKTYEEIASVLDEDNEFLIEMYHNVESETANSSEISYQYAMDSYCLYAAGKKAEGHSVVKAYKLARYVSARAGEGADSANVSVETPANRVGMAANQAGLSKGVFRGYQWSQTSKEKSNYTYIYSFLLSLGNQIGPVFCIPPNKDLRSYWDRVEDRLFKIRNCMNISGVRRDLALFAPEINPMLLVRAKAAGLSLEDVLNSISGNVPPYRFSYLIERAKAYAALLQGFGSALLSALEKKDIEDLNLLRTTQQQNILRMTSQVRDNEYNAALATIESLEARRNTVEARRDYYDALVTEGLSSEEQTQQDARETAQYFEVLGEATNILAALTYLVPQLGSFFAITYGGREGGASGAMFAQWMRSGAAIANSIAASAGLEAGFKRREQGWQHQKDQADIELTEIEQQKKIAEIRRDITLELKDIHDETLKQQNEIYEFYHDRFSNLGLYTWLSTSLQRLYREAYNNAYSMAKLAERAYRFERGDDAAELIGASHWEASKAGLLAGERLLLDLQNLERRFIETNYRSIEIDQAFSLTQIAPDALIQLKETGECAFSVQEIFFNLFYPGHYKRKIKAVRLTIPCVTGPYTNVSATLELTDSWIRTEPKANVTLRQVPRSRTVAIATSTAQNDAGVFELNFRDERYMPFEGAGAISSWSLSLPRNFRQFDYQTINDVIIHISYTAEQDSGFRAAVEDQNGQLEGTIRHYLMHYSLPRVFSFRQEFSSEFNRLLHSPTGTSVPSVRFSISEKQFPMFLRGMNLTVIKAALVLRTPTGQNVDDVTILVNEKEQASFSVTPDEWGGLPFKDVTAVFASGIMADHTISFANAGALAPSSPLPGDVSAVDSEKLTDIYLCLNYGIR